jgi:hypothetical protein
MESTNPNYFGGISVIYHLSPFISTEKKHNRPTNRSLYLRLFQKVFR